MDAAAENGRNLASSVKAESSSIVDEPGEG